MNQINKCVSLGAIPTSYKESLSYEEQLIVLGEQLASIIPTAENFNLTEFTNYGPSDASINTGNIDGLEMSLATNKNHTLFKLYGNLIVRNSALARPEVTIRTSLRPKENFFINCAGTFYDETNTYFGKVNVEINTNGIVKILPINVSGATNLWKGYCILSPCLYFANNFSDNGQ